MWGGNQPSATPGYPVCYVVGTTPLTLPLGPRHSFLQLLELLVPNSSQLSLPSPKERSCPAHGYNHPSPTRRGQPATNA